MIAARLQALLNERYTIDRQIGAGGMATVYLALDRKHDRHVAVKVLRHELGLDTTSERLRREISITARLIHPNIMPLFDSGEVEGSAYFVMPYMEGSTLRDRLSREGSLDLDRAIAIAGDVADALEYAHARGIVHRDIKPENILLEGDRALVADFGIARASSRLEGRLTTPGMTIGTPAYLSPEQAVGDDVSPASDQYSLACVLYEMISGSPPFTGDTSQAIVVQHLTREPPWLDKRGGLEAISGAVHRAMSKDPRDRFASCAQFAAALRSHGAASAPAPPLKRVAQQSVAVLPFVNMSPDPEHEFFSDGLSEDLIHVLSRIPGLHVTARTSAFAFKGRTVTPSEVGRKLHVNCVLLGSVRRASNRMRVTAQLVNTTNETELWSERFDRELVDIFALQDDIAGHIAEALQLTIFGAHAADDAPHDFETYEIYLKGRFLWNKRSVPALEQALDYFSRAIERDKGFALAHAGLADVLATIGMYGVRPPHAVMPMARGSATTAITLDQRIAEPYATLGCVRALYDWDWVGAEESFRRAIALEPNYALAHHWLAVTVLAPLGRLDEARAELHSAKRLDPLSPSIAATIGLVSFYERDYVHAEREYRDVIELNPDFGIVHYFLAHTLRLQGRPADAVASYTRALELMGESAEVLAGRGAALAESGDLDAARKHLPMLSDIASRHYVSPALVAQVHIALGEPDVAITHLQRAAEDRSAEMAWLRSPLWDAMRGREDFELLRARVGTPP
jgi:serine/threonine-protein kinase